MMIRIYINRLREQGKFKTQSETKIREMIESSMDSKINVHLTADEAVTWGFADGIFVGDTVNLRATVVNKKRRDRLMNVLRKPINVDVVIT